MSHTNRVYLIHDSLPLFVTVLSFILMVLFARESWENMIVKQIDKYNIDVEFQKEKDRKYLSHVDLKLIIYFIIILIVSFGMFLS
jgi:endo-1,4-beta-mannosidase